MINVMLTGEGSDELAGGYGRFSAGYYQSFIRRNNLISSSLKKHDTFAEYHIMSDSTVRYTNNGADLVELIIQNEIKQFNLYKGTDLSKQIKHETSRRLPETLDKTKWAWHMQLKHLDNNYVDYIMQLPEKYLIAFQKAHLVNCEKSFDWIEGKYF